jgi:hypothetical protein
MGHFSLPRRAAHATALLSLTVGLSGCASWFHHDPGANASCPHASVVPDLGQLTRFQGTDTRFNDQTYKASLVGLGGSCTFTETSVSVNATVKILAERGPAGGDGTQDFPYFVAIQGPDGDIVAKTNFSAPLDFAHGQNRSGSAETLNEVIPLASPDKAVGYRILIGFQLSPTERAYNQAHEIGEGE